MKTVNVKWLARESTGFGGPRPVLWVEEREEGELTMQGCYRSHAELMRRHAAESLRFAPRALRFSPGM